MMHKLLSLLAALVLAGCTTVVSGPQLASDGAFVVSVARPRTLPTVLSTLEEAVAEARFKCWSARRELSVLSQVQETHSGPLGLDHKATVTFVCTGGPEAADGLPASAAREPGRAV